MNEGMSPADMAAVVGNNHYPMYNNGYGFGGDGGWLWLILILAFMNNGWGNGFGAGAFPFALNNTDRDIDDRFISRDIFATNQNVSTTGAGLASDICQSTAGINSNIANLGYNLTGQVAENKYDTSIGIMQNRFDNQLGLQNLGTQMQNCCCQTQKDVANVNYNIALQTQQLSSQLATEACDTRATSTANTQKILDKLCTMENDNLRSKLSEKEAQIQELQLENSQKSLAQNIVDQIRPSASPAWIVASPYTSIYNPYTSSCGCGYSNLA